MDHKEIIQAYVKRAKEAQKSIDHYTQEQIDRLCVAIGYEVYQDDNILKLATCAVEETGM
ncbi:MAG TPA: aldehyde dehydrogenase, partial [Acholeplasmataceae bacterium]|nr:aldehyde dehydrogenase [Acholeplasmataceae bacterium]